MLRNRHGRFIKRKHHKKHRRHTNPHGHHTRHRGRHRGHHGLRRRRRGNPHLIVANPSTGQLHLPLGGVKPVLIDDVLGKLRPVLVRRSRHKGGAMKKKRKRARRRRRGHGLRSLRGYRIVHSRGRRPRLAVGTRRKGRRRFHMYHPRRGRRARMRVFRRTNPFHMGKFLTFVRIGVAGGLGIVAARISGRLYTDYVGKHVGVAGDAKSWRNIANEALRIVAMGGLPMLAHRQLLRRLPMITSTDGMAFEIGALAEAGRQAIGVALKSVVKDRGRWGLDGMGNYDQVVDNGQHILGFKNGQWWMLGHSHGGGMAGLQPGYPGTWPLGRAGAFGGAERADGFGDFNVALNEEDDVSESA